MLLFTNKQSLFQLNSVTHCMAKKKKGKKAAKKKAQPKGSFFDDLSHQTKQGIAAVGFVLFGILITLSLTNMAGMIGTWVNSALTSLFGGGKYLAPLACGFYVYAMLNPKDNEEVSMSKIFGIAMLFLSLLGSLSLYAEGLGGWIGWSLYTPLNYLMGGLATGIAFFALLLVGVFLTFNMGLALPSFGRKEEPVSDDIENLDIPEDTEEPALPEEEGVETEDEIEEAETKKTKSVGERFGISKKDNKKTDFTAPSYTGPYSAPPINLLAKGKGKAKNGDVKANANAIKRTLQEFGITVEMDQVEIGPTVTRYALKPAQGVKLSRIVGLQRELELNLGGSTIRIEAPIPGKSLVGIEVPNTEKATIGLASLITSPEFSDSPQPLLTALGKDITGKAHFANIARMPHGLIAGTTGSGKSVMIHNLIISLLYRNSPDQLRLIMVDPKRVELSLYDGIPHLLTPVITDAKKALMALKWAVKEMERRYDILKENRVQNLNSYHENIYKPAKEDFEASSYEDPEEEASAKEDLPEPLPYIVVVMDELADLMQAYPRELEASIVRLAQMSRAVGIHLLLATQRPSVNVITGTIKANIPTRLAMKVASQIDSRTILDQIGAEKLLGQGDMLFSSDEYLKPIRLQSAFISEGELKKVVDFLKNQSDLQELDSIDLDAKADGNDSDAFFGSMVDDEEEDDLYEDAKQAVIDAGKASTSYLQRKLRIGYSRAARLMDILEDKGVIGPQDGSKPREILFSDSSDDIGEEVNSEEY